MADTAGSRTKLVDEEDYLRRFRNMGVVELVDAWEEPMPDAVRALLLDELETRGYRTKSLPEPPPAAEGSAIAPLSRTAQARERVQWGAWWVLAIALLQIVSGGYLGFSAAMDMPEGERTAQALALGIPIGLGLAFLLLYSWARSSPRPALLAALLLFVLAHGAEAVHDPESIPRGLLFKVLAVGGLLSGLLGTMHRERKG